MICAARSSKSSGSPDASIATTPGSLASSIGLGRRQHPVLGAQSPHRHGRRGRRAGKRRRLIPRLLAGRAGHSGDREHPGAARTLLQLVGGGDHAHGPHGRMAALQRRQPVHRGSAGVHDIRVVGLVGDDPGARLAQAVQPRLLRRAHELDQRQRLLPVGTLLRGEGGAVGGRVDLAGGGLDGAHVRRGARRRRFAAARRRCPGPRPGRRTRSVRSHGHRCDRAPPCPRRRRAPAGGVGDRQDVATGRSPGRQKPCRPEGRRRWPKKRCARRLCEAFHAGEREFKGRADSASQQCFAAHE